MIAADQAQGAVDICSLTVFRGCLSGKQYGESSQRQGRETPVWVAFCGSFYNFSAERGEVTNDKIEDTHTQSALSFKRTPAHTCT